MPCRRLWYETWYCTPESDPCITICWGLSSVSMICLVPKEEKRQNRHTHTHTQFCPIFVPRNLWANTRFFSLRNQSMPSRRRATPKAWMRTTHIHWIDDASPLLVYGVLNKLSIRWSAVHVVLTWIAAPSPVTLDGCKSLTCIWCIK